MAAHPLSGMLLATGACLAVVLAMTDAGARGAVLLGMAGPLVLTTATWVVVERTARRAPERVGRLMIVLFGTKMVLVGAFVIGAVLSLRTAAIAFVVSFTVHYIVLHLVEAWYLRRLFSGDAAALGR